MEKIIIFSLTPLLLFVWVYGRVLNYILTYASFEEIIPLFDEQNYLPGSDRRIKMLPLGEGAYLKKTKLCTLRYKIEFILDGRILESITKDQRRVSLDDEDPRFKGPWKREINRVVKEEKRKIKKDESERERRERAELKAQYRKTSIFIKTEELIKALCFLF